MRSDARENDDNSGHQTYTCYSAGHIGDDREFEDHSEQWFIENRGNTPRHCKPCRRWFKAQEQLGTITVTCSECGVKFNITAEHRISYHKDSGAWTVPRLCYACEGDPAVKYRPRQTAGRTAGSAAFLERRKPEIYENTTRLDEPQLLTIPTNLEAYVTARRGVGRKVETLWEHITQLEHGWNGAPDQEILAIMLRVAASTDPTTTRQVFQTNGLIAKCDTTLGVVLLVDDSNAPPPFVDAFKPDDPLDYVYRQINTPRVRPRGFTYHTV